GSRLTQRLGVELGEMQTRLKAVKQLVSLQTPDRNRPHQLLDLLFSHVEVDIGELHFLHGNTRDGMFSRVPGATRPAWGASSPRLFSMLRSTLRAPTVRVRVGADSDTSKPPAAFMTGFQAEERPPQKKLVPDLRPMLLGASPRVWPVPDKRYRK